MFADSDFRCIRISPGRSSERPCDLVGIAASTVYLDETDLTDTFPGLLDTVYNMSGKEETERNETALW